MKTELKKRIRNKDNYYKTRREIINAYGGACACCGETQFEFLQIDHVNGTGVPAKLRYKKAKTSTGYQLYSWIKRNGFPAYFQVLCGNCNYVERFGVPCPHNTFDLRRGLRFIA